MDERLVRGIAIKASQHSHNKLIWENEAAQRGSLRFCRRRQRQIAAVGGFSHYFPI